MENEQTYIGDGVYVWFDGYQVWLKTNAHTKIALEPEVMKQLIKFTANKSGYDFLKNGV